MYVHTCVYINNNSALSNWLPMHMVYWPVQRGSNKKVAWISWHLISC